MDFVRRDADPEFVALDIRGEAESPEVKPDMMMESAFTGRAIERERNGDTNSSSTGMEGIYEKQMVPVHVDGSPREQLHPSTPTAGGGKRRRANRRVPGWRDPRKILFAFAALVVQSITCGRQLGILIEGQNVQRGHVDTAILHALHGKGDRRSS